MSTKIPQFPTTDWSMLAHAADDQASGQRLSLDQLLRRYLPPMRRYLLTRRRVSEQFVDDLLQGFITDRVMGKGLLKHADRQRGKFRNLLIRSLTNYTIDRFRREQSRDERRPVLQLSDETFVLANEDSDPAGYFDHLWAEHVMAEALSRTRERLTVTDRRAAWEVFNRRMVEGMMDEDYRQLAARFGFETPTQVSTAMLTAKRVFARQLRDVLGEFGGERADLNEELRDLKRIFERSRAEW